MHRRHHHTHAALLFVIVGNVAIPIAFIGPGAVIGAITDLILAVLFPALVFYAALCGPTPRAWSSFVVGLLVLVYAVLGILGVADMFEVVGAYDGWCGTDGVCMQIRDGSVTLKSQCDEYVDICDSFGLSLCLPEDFECEADIDFSTELDPPLLNPEFNATCDKVPQLFREVRQADGTVDPNDPDLVTCAEYGSFVPVMAVFLILASVTKTVLASALFHACVRGRKVAATAAAGGGTDVEMAGK